MAAPQIDFSKRIRRIPQHVEILPHEAAFPLAHFERSANDFWNLVRYVDRNLGNAPVDRVAYEAHIRRLCTMVLLSLVETFERFLKETAAVCIDQIGRMVLDDRMKEFQLRGHVL